MHRGAFVLAGVFTFITPIVAFAQVSPSTRDDEARTRFERGRDAFNRGEFSVAATEFERAYALSRRPQLLYNIGTAHERLHRWELARTAFQRYLDEVPDAHDRDEVRARLTVIDAELSREAAPPPDPRVVIVERRVAVTPRSRPWRIAFFVTGGLTVLAGVGTLAVGLLANQRYDELRASCAPDCRNDDVSDMRLRQGIINGGIVATATFFAASVTSIIIDSVLQSRTAHREPAQRTTAGVAPLPGGAVFTLGGTL